MQADRDDRITTNERSRHSTQTLVTAVAVLILAGGAYLLAPGDEDDDPVTPAASEPMAPATPVLTPPQPNPALAIREAPDVPEEEPLSAPEPLPDPEPEEAPPPPPPTPEELDSQVRSMLADTGFSPPPVLAASFSAPYLLDRGVSSLDQVARGLVPRRTLNLARPEGAFTTRRDGTRYFVDPGSYRRYDSLVSGVTALSVDNSAALFQTFRPLLREAYASLGYPADLMDNTLIAALDAIIAAPVRDTPPELVSKGALWAYEDAELESASDLHKQLLRLGPDNTRALQTWATSLRSTLLGD
jgi:hypothetical protein